ncbi:hypothetical protein [Flavobacterium proteolyticum]|uniref:2TM domain-containing protein n=1 Tax=Flavobacterium proteolyticum TaxID=2911683 RepID=A0ABR9WS82_9FLAO|nr:hypothetical protein [Flavobacterium proteolyticum]MBE9575606.1 hypothetical protein [Flavobacterium proteolyticum]
MKKELSTSEIIIKGHLWVNLPITILIISGFYIIHEYLKQSFNIALIGGIVIGWTYWSFSVKRWIKWALTNNVDSEKLYKIGIRNLLIWSRNDIKQVADKLNKE